MHNTEQRICQNCKKEFVIEPEDFDFYEKVKVPPPTWCPECRLIRRMNFRNERALYKGKCDLCGKDTISIYSNDKPFTVYCHDCWWSDKWTAPDFSKSYDFEKTFFVQWREFLDMVPRMALSVANMVDCQYCNLANDDKECYLISATSGNERTMFSNRVVSNKDSLDLYVGDKNELCYELVNCLQCYKVFFSKDSIQCQESSFLNSCSNCVNCFGCMNLKNKRYCILNKQLSKDEYQRRIKDFDISSFSKLSHIKKEYRDFVLKNIHRFATNIKSVECTGDNVRQGKNCKFCFDVVGDPSAQDCKFAFWAGYNAKGCYDIGPGGGLGVECSYEITDTGLGSNKALFAVMVYGSFNTIYCLNSNNCSNCFACIGLRNKQYCILNKQYTKQEYEALVPKIIEHMNIMPYVDKKGRVYKYGEFFPAELSPFCYNETIAQEYFPLTKEQAIEQGYSWKDPEPRNYQIDIATDQLPDNIKDVPDDIVGKVIECGHQGKCQEQCTEAFRIIPQELAFYRRMNLPLPRLCPNCRHYQRLKQRNPLKLWTRQCQHPGCPNTFETSYAPDRPEIVYCEGCYLKEVV